jgi:hypothetical protein
MAFSLRVSASFRFPLYGMHGVSATRPIGHESFFQASIEAAARRMSRCCFRNGSHGCLVFVGGRLEVGSVHA